MPTYQPAQFNVLRVRSNSRLDREFDSTVDFSGEVIRMVVTQSKSAGCKPKCGAEPLQASPEVATFTVTPTSYKLRLTASSSQMTMPPGVYDFRLEIITTPDISIIGEGVFEVY